MKGTALDTTSFCFARFLSNATSHFQHAVSGVRVPGCSAHVGTESAPNNGKQSYTYK